MPLSVKQNNKAFTSVYIKESLAIPLITYKSIWFFSLMISLHTKERENRSNIEFNLKQNIRLQPRFNYYVNILAGLTYITAVL